MTTNDNNNRLYTEANTKRKITEPQPISDCSSAKKSKKADRLGSTSQLHRTPHSPKTREIIKARIKARISERYRLRKVAAAERAAQRAAAELAAQTPEQRRAAADLAVQQHAEQQQHYQLVADLAAYDKVPCTCGNLICPGQGNLAWCLDYINDK